MAMQYTRVGIICGRNAIRINKYCTCHGFIISASEFSFNRYRVAMRSVSYPYLLSELCPGPSFSNASSYFSSKFAHGRINKSKSRHKPFDIYGVILLSFPVAEFCCAQRNI